jgi:hypothetical protein
MSKIAERVQKRRQAQRASNQQPPSVPPTRPVAGITQKIAATGEHVTGLCDLPTELMLRIGQELPPGDVRNFRLVCRSAEEAGTDLFKSRLTRLYVHPSRLADVLAMLGSGG